MLLKVAVWSDSSSTVLRKSKNKHPLVLKMLVTLLVNHLDYLLFADMTFFPLTFMYYTNQPGIYKSKVI